MHTMPRLSPDYAIRRDSIDGIHRAMRMTRISITCSRVMLDHLSGPTIANIRAASATLNDDARQDTASALAELNRAMLLNMEYIQALEAEARALGDLLLLCLEPAASSQFDMAEMHAPRPHAVTGVIDLARHRREQVQLDSLIDVTTRRIEELCRTLGACRDELLLALGRIQCVQSGI